MADRLRLPGAWAPGGGPRTLGELLDHQARIRAASRLQRLRAQAMRDQAARVRVETERLRGMRP